ncbi:MAG: tRNA 2-thiouridine(34) synthase MnmA [Candidatus Magasanikbacteria bacterium CG_4_10_14_0_8_um_filter_32_14]|uniref:tRNA-specific 2-thiouridylase MnmA n=2 Tax=Candidatus Magasanikiibacteriota TaxID=1752731 RepID=A0A2M7R940_9BACT|nr:MAG: tRNA 2-thiouridine(34) synthase MnmA [Candidatus Magasanikbacteria bacterium CG1_02_32_51]PIY93081.1 MAG: tRNA 2-thiouridine(34) synthase MnmA [Candidatus Magasanikbacteria bacterium CG_4_10_14_0_8_um_filter_32_14]
MNKNLDKKEKILVAMSGGVDSSVVAALLVEAGFDVTGAYMINYEETRINTDNNAEINADNNFCWIPDYRDALRVAAKLGISLLKLDFQKEYKEKVLDYMFAEYKKGNTPNPDVMCNKFIKFGVWLDKIKELGFDKIATGHYATVVKSQKHVVNNVEPSKVKSYELRQAKDENKDQTYFLHQLNQEQLSKTMFPLGEYTKVEVRELAKKFDLPTATKAESMGICFVGELDMKEFLQKDLPKNPGNIVLENGDIVGKHEGLAFYTIGQRHGFEQQGGGEPLFVVDKNKEKNELVVGSKNSSFLNKDEIKVANIHWISGCIGRSFNEGGQIPDFPLKCTVRLRHRQALQEVLVSQNGDNFDLKFLNKQRASTPGQFAVFYKDGECLGGGVII